MSEKALRNKLLLAMSEVHSGNGAEGNAILDAILSALAEEVYVIEQGWIKTADRLPEWREDYGLKTAPTDRPIQVHRNGWSQARCAKRSAGGWWVNGERYTAELDRWAPMLDPPAMTSDWPEGEPVRPCIDCADQNNREELK